MMNERAPLGVLPTLVRRFSVHNFCSILFPPPYFPRSCSLNGSYFSWQGLHSVALASATRFSPPYRLFPLLFSISAPPLSPCAYVALFSAFSRLPPSFPPLSIPRALLSAEETFLFRELLTKEEFPRPVRFFLRISSGLPPRRWIPPSPEARVIEFLLRWRRLAALLFFAPGANSLFERHPRSDGTPFSLPPRYLRHFSTEYGTRFGSLPLPFSHFCFLPCNRFHPPSHASSL